MIKVINKNIWDSNAEIIVCPVNTLGEIHSTMLEHIRMYCPHVETEYFRYLKHCNKNKITPKATVQYVPDESWAMPMVDTMKNKNLVACNNEFRYIANAFCQYDSDEQTVDNMKAFKKCMEDIKNNAEFIKAKTITIPAEVCMDFREYDMALKVIYDIFSKTDIDVLICKQD